MHGGRKSTGRIQDSWPAVQFFNAINARGLLEMLSTRMSRNQHRVVVIAAAVIFIAAGAWHGNYTGRWSSQRASTDWPKLATLPRQVADWDGTDQVIEQTQLKVAEIEDYLARVYRHNVTGMEISVFVLAGRAGPISVHTPDVCFSGAGLKLISTRPPESVTDKNRIHYFNEAVFGREASQVGELLVAWSWSANSAWETPLNPRWHFAQKPRIYKIYVSRSIGEPTPESEKQWKEFLAKLIPQLNGCVFAQKPPEVTGVSSPEAFQPIAKGGRN